MITASKLLNELSEFINSIVINILKNDERITENGQEMYFYDYSFGIGLNQELKDTLERKD